MASNAVSSEPLSPSLPKQTVQTSTWSAWDTAAAMLAPLASLKLTVALFAMGIFIVLVATLAQVNMDMWEVMDRYFQSWFAWIELQVFFPRSWAPSMQSIPGGIWFPGGALIGLLMVLNLGAAHLVRFKIQARGRRLWGGVAVLVAGVVFTWLVIASGHNREGLQSEPPLGGWTTLWWFVKLGLAASCAAAIGAVFAWPMRESQSRRVERGLLITVAGVLLILSVYVFLAGDRAYLGDSGMRILWQLILGTGAGVSILAASVMLFRKRGGIVTLHLGVGLLMFGQFFVSKYDVEEQMTIEEGQTVSYARDIRQTELAVVDSTDPTREEVVVVPRPILEVSARGGQRSWFSGLMQRDYPVDERGIIQHADLPFHAQVLKYYENARLRDVEEGDENLATHGTGKRFIADPIRASTGTDSSSEVDFAAAYVKFTDKEGKDLGTYLLSQIAASQDFTEQVEANGKTYEVALRFQRNYKPYAVTLLDVRKDDYLGTDVPRNYSSDVRLVDNSRGTDREIHIWMNNPLRYAGETFYQSGYSAPPLVPRETTTLAVVTNSGWMIPYVACMVVVVGLLGHFSGTLLRFLKRQAVAPPPAPVAAHGAKSAKNRKQGPPVAPSPGWLATWFPAAVVAFFALMLLRAAAPPHTDSNELQLAEFGQLPVIADGRVKPFDTLARNSLRVISNRYTFKGRLSESELKEAWPEISEDLARQFKGVSARQLQALKADVPAAVALIVIDTGENRYRVEESVDKLTTRRYPATRWLLDVIARPAVAEQHKVFRIDNLEVLDTLDLERRKSHLYSVAELRDGIEEFERQAAQAAKTRETDVTQLTTYQRKLLELDRRIRTYTRLAAAFQPPNLPDLPTGEDLQNNREEALEQIRRFHQIYSRFVQSIDATKPPLSVPREGEDGDDEWESYAEAWAAGYLDARLFGQEPGKPLGHLNAILVAYADGDASRFNREVARYQDHLSSDPPPQIRAQDSLLNRFIAGRFGTFYGFEAYFNHVSPFFFCWWPYIAAFLFSCLAWLGWSRPLNRAAFWLIVFTFGIHTLALIARMYISGRPPVTNLYSSAVFIGWAVVIFGLVLEWFYRNGLGNVLASALGFASLVIAHNLAGDGDTFTVLQAVLDTQFWLALHVVTVTLGYATTFLAGFLGVAYVLRGWFTRSLTSVARKELARMIYGIVCFSIFFSFFGTVLGGLWADDSWGRFWGWDPKENGALIIVLWNALVLHARWGALVKDRGLAVLAVGGNIVTSWSWFGVNELGVGLHSYGFTEGVLLMLALFVGSQLSIIILGVLPRSLWWSFRQSNPGDGAVA